MLLENDNTAETAYGIYDLKRYCADANLVQARRVYQRVMALGVEYSQLYRIVLTGGGALLYENNLRKLFNDPRLIIKDNSVISNARGFYLYGKFN